MSHFSNALQIAMEHYPGSRKAFADSIGMPASTLHGYYHGSTPPTVEDLGKIIETLDPAMRAFLVTSHLRDQVPASAQEFVRVLNLLAEPTMKEVAEAEYVKVTLPPALQADFVFLARKAIEHPEVADMISSTARLLRGR
jgi:hypothetical protein